MSSKESKNVVYGTDANLYVSMLNVQNTFRSPVIFLDPSMFL